MDRRRPETLLGAAKEGAAGAARPGEGGREAGGAEFDAAGRRRLGRGDLEDRLARLQEEKGAKEREKLGSAARRSAEEAAVISQLKARDGEVRAHEAAHVAAGGSYIRGAASYSYQRGPDGQSYAIGGEVGIDSSPIPGKPEETLAKMQVVRAAALAPADPSGADLSVAGAAAQAMAQAMAQIAEERAAPAAEGAAAAGQADAMGRSETSSSRTERNRDTEGGIQAAGGASRPSSGAPAPTGPEAAAPTTFAGSERSRGPAAYRLASEPEALPGARIDLVA